MPEQRERRLWQVPRWDGNLREEVFQFSKQQVEDGRDYFETSPGHEELEESIKLLSGIPNDRLALKQKDERYSRLQTARLKRNLREMVNALSDINMTPGYHSDNNDTQAQAELMNRIATSWYVNNFIDLKIKRGVQWFAIAPGSYLEICFRSHPGIRGKKDIDIFAHSAFSVVTTGNTESGDLQESYTVTIIKDLPVYLAHGIWPEFAEILTPDRETPRGWIERMKDIARDVFMDGPEKATAKNPTVRLYYQYVLDLSINESQEPVKMGYKKMPDGSLRETDYSYTVPYLGQMIPTGTEENGQPVYRVANEDDARMFPGRRLIVFNEKRTIYDGPFWDWHGMVPLIKLSGDAWPFGDFSMVHDVANIQQTIGEIERIMHQTIRNRYQPSIAYNYRAIAREKAKSIRTDVTGQRIGYNGAEGNDPIKPLLPKEFYSIEESTPAFLKYLMDEMGYQMGTIEAAALAKMKITGSDDSMEKTLAAAGPIVKGISRDMERAMRDLAEMFKWLVFQYYTTAKIMQIVGPDGTTAENFDYDPGNLIPSHLPGENRSRNSAFSRMQRAKWQADHLSFMIVPGTLHSITQMSQKLMYLQLYRAGFPIDPWTLAEVLQIPNFGKRPEGTNSMMERFFAFQKIMLEHQASLSAEAQELGGGGEGQGGPPGLGPKGGNKGTGGRASSGQAAPKLQTKGDGRPIVRESK